VAQLSVKPVREPAKKFTLSMTAESVGSITATSAATSVKKNRFNDAYDAKAE
jgi:hypothetical protein